ncbi:MAG: hypothetical protein AAGI23_07425 [Bacteroidota bacterium]
MKFRTDAHPNYFAKPETFAAFIDPQSFGHFTGTAKVNGGYGMAFFKASEEVEIGENAQITLEVRPPGQKSLSATLDIISIEPPENSDPKNSGGKRTPNINVHYVNKDDPYFIENNWNELDVASIEEGQDEINIFVSEENKNLTRLIARAQRKNDEAVRNVKNKYLEHISFHAFVLSKNKPENYLAEEDSAISSETLDKIRSAELFNASETVCGIINDFFEVIITESIEEDESVLTK